MRRPVLVLALVCHLVLATGYLVRTPAFEGPDENGHAYYASFLAHRHSLPVVEGSSEPYGLSPWDESPVGHHPPLYYGLLAVTMQVLGHADTVPTFSLAENPTPLHFRHGHDELSPVSAEIVLLWVLRGWSVLLGLITIVLVHRLGRMVFVDRPVVADGAALLLACLPQFSFIHGVLDNGNLAITLSHGVLLVLVVALSRGRLSPRTGAALGALTGLALITKLTSLFLVPVLGVTYLVCLWRWSDRRREILHSGAWLAAVTVAISGWAFLRNVELYGDPMAQAAMGAISAEHMVPEGMELDFFIQIFLPGMFTSFVGFFGWWTLPAPLWLLIVWIGLLVLGGVGWFVGWRRGFRPLAGMWVLLLAAVVLFTSVAQFNLTFVAPHGRYLFPAAGPLLIALVAGLVLLGERVAVSLGKEGRGLCGVWPRRVLCLLSPVVAAIVLQFYFTPVFAIPPPQDPYYATLIADVATPTTVGEGVAGVELLQPVDGAQVQEPPVFRWSADESGAPYALHMFSGSRIWVATEQNGLRLSAGEWTVPAEFWSRLPFDEEISWKIRRLPDRARGESVADVAQSTAFRFVRVR